MESRTYIAIDLKSFYASVECVQRNLDPLRTNLVVADESRTSKTICLAVSPSLKALGIPGRPRLFEVEQKIAQANALRAINAPAHKLKEGSFDAEVLNQEADRKIEYITATPRMSLYMDYSLCVYHIYLNYVAPEDIHVYSIDEVFMDVTQYLGTYKVTAKELAMRMIREVLEKTGITATVGIGTNLYLCKIAMDIVAKHVPPDQDGVRIASLDELTYRKLLWGHEPLTDFWRVGKGYANRLAQCGMKTMGDIARCSLGKEDEFHNEELLYKMFGVNAELLIDHAWGYEPCTIAQIKAYQPQDNSISIGQVLSRPYTFEQARIVIKEMADMLSLKLVQKGKKTSQIILTVGYDVENLMYGRTYEKEVTIDRYGRAIPKAAHKSSPLFDQTASTKKIIQETVDLYDAITDSSLLIRRITLAAGHVSTSQSEAENNFEQMDLFSYLNGDSSENKEQKREEKLQQAMLEIKNRFGKNAILKGMNLQKDATAREQNHKIGGHNA